MGYISVLFTYFTYLPLSQPALAQLYLGLRSTLGPRSTLDPLLYSGAQMYPVANFTAQW